MRATDQRFFKAALISIHIHKNIPLHTYDHALGMIPVLAELTK